MCRRAGTGMCDFVTIVLTTCTRSKAQTVAERHQFGRLAKAPVRDLAEAWAAAIHEGPKVPAGSLYKGRAYSFAAQAAKLMDARVLIASAGLGLITAEDKVPPYACTILQGEADSIPGRSTDRVTPATWWAKLQTASPFARKLSSDVAADKGLILVALSDAYLEMLSGDLLALPDSARARIRLFTRAPRSRVPADLHGSLMPYDDRLDGEDSTHRGTRDNFAARALKHFVETIWVVGDSRSSEAHWAKVEEDLAGWRMPIKAERQRASDATIIELMIAHWASTGGTHSRLLKLLRHDLHIQCEQGRCRALAALVRERMA